MISCTYGTQVAYTLQNIYITGCILIAITMNPWISALIWHKTIIHDSKFYRWQKLFLSEIAVNKIRIMSFLFFAKSFPTKTPGRGRRHTKGWLPVHIRLHSLFTQGTPLEDYHVHSLYTHVHPSKGSYNKDAGIKIQLKIVLILIYSITLTCKIRNKYIFILLILLNSNKN